jgi:hypothetical protein
MLVKSVHTAQFGYLSHPGEKDMLSRAEVERIAKNLAKISLDPVTYFAVVGAIAGAIITGTTLSRDEVSVGNGATASAPKPSRKKLAAGASTGPAH